MAIEINGKTIETTDHGYLVNHLDWDEEVARRLAEIEGIALTEKYWDLICYLRDQYLTNNRHQPMERAVLKHMGTQWGTKPTSKDLYTLFPLAPTKQGTKIAGLPEVLRKGGY